MLDKKRMKLIGCKAILSSSFRQLAILKAVDPLLLESEMRINRKMDAITKKALDQAVQDKLGSPEFVGLTVEQTSTLYDAIYKAYSEHLLTTYRSAEKQLLENRQVALTKSPLTTEKLTNLLENRTFNASQKTMDRITGDVFGTIKKTISEGKSYENTTKELMPEFRNMAKYEVQRISRTETHSTMNQSKQDTFMAAPNVRGKKWLSSGLPNMRPAHEEADGQTVAVDEPFIVDGEALMYPGDPDGSAENIINCACTMTPDIRYGRD